MAASDTFDFVFGRLKKGSENHPEKDTVGHLCKLLEEQKATICEGYNSINYRIKTIFMENDKGQLDRHKCAASFMVAFLENFVIPEDKRNKERIAIFLGMLILKVFITEECRNNSDLSFIEFINRNKGLKFPKCVCSEDPYDFNWSLGMFHDRNTGILSVLALSNILFQIENHNRMLFKNEILRK